MPRSKKIFSWLLLGLIILLFISWPKPARAVLGFGGRITNVTICLNGMLFAIGPPVGGLFMYVPGTLTFAYAQLRPGPWALGGFTPGGVCILPFGSIPALGTMIMIGTSLF